MTRSTAFACLLAAITLGAGRATPLTAQSVSQPAAQSTPQPAASPLAAARALEESGEWESAEAAYRALVTAGGETGPAAALELARLYEREERYTDAAALLAPLTALPSANTTLTRAWFQYGSVLQAQGQSGASIAAYARYVELRGPAEGYARVEMAKMLVDGEQREAALDTLAPLLAGGGPENARRIAYRIGAKAADDLGQSETALTYYRAHATAARSAAERTPSLYRAGELERDRGATDAAVELFRSLIARYPASREAEQALDALTAMGRTVSTLEAANVHYRRGNDSTAWTLFNQALAGASSATERATALFYLAALAERRDDAALALENYGQSFDAQPDGPLAADALWWQGGILERMSRPAEAQALYARILAGFPSSTYAAEAAFRNGYLSYTSGRVGEARDRWQAGAVLPRASGAARSLFWAAKSQAELGDSNAARATYADAARRDPTGYYGLRAAAVLAGAPRAPRNGPATVTPVVQDWPSAEAWLTSWAGAEDASRWAGVQAGDDWRAGVELANAGWIRVANETFQTLLAHRLDQPWALYRAARALAEIGFANPSESAAIYLIQAAPAGSAAPPSTILRLGYPLPWADQMQRAADRSALDPLLLAALIRQESAFNSVAGSPAGAFGLTQVVEGTAKEIARALGRDSFRFIELARPSLALQFGAFYLSGQIRGQDGDVGRGLAAYNAGGGSANRWDRLAIDPTDPDRFYESIDYSETRAYLRLVMENYAWYRFLYGRAATPSLTP